MTKVTFVRSVEGKGDKRLYRLETPITLRPFGRAVRVKYVVSSACDTWDGPETMIFQASRSGEILSWMDLGVCRGEFNHKAALLSAGLQLEEE